MLTKFEVSNFKNFAEKFTFDLTQTNNYVFNQNAVHNGIIKNALIYGHNGVGKSNLGFAIFDLISHLTDKHSDSKLYKHYINAFSPNDIAIFKYEFLFNHNSVIYEYGKYDKETLVYENLYINNIKYASIDRRNNTTAIINAEGAENLKRDIGDSKISIISYIEKNTILAKNNNNDCFYQFIEFINGMLYFRSLFINEYIGLKQGNENIGNYIIKNGSIDDLQLFLNEAGIDCKLKVIKQENEDRLAVNFNEKLIPLYEISSSGTIALVLFYYWLQNLKHNSKSSFLFIDEFDAFYHHSLSEIVIKRLKDINIQVIITTHNTSIITNDLLRPDCYFLMNNYEIKSLANKTSKELREAHNIEKMYRAGVFGE